MLLSQPLLSILFSQLNFVDSFRYDFVFMLLSMFFLNFFSLFLSFNLVFKIVAHQFLLFSFPSSLNILLNPIEFCVMINNLVPYRNHLFVQTRTQFYFFFCFGLFFYFTNTFVVCQVVFVVRAGIIRMRWRNAFILF